MFKMKQLFKNINWSNVGVGVGVGLFVLFISIVAIIWATQTQTTDTSTVTSPESADEQRDDLQQKRNDSQAYLNALKIIRSDINVQKKELERTSVSPESYEHIIYPYQIRILQEISNQLNVDITRTEETINDINTQFLAISI
jgi:uncharacterized membrane protein YhiD involved in acid resistance